MSRSRRNLIIFVFAIFATCLITQDFYLMTDSRIFSDSPFWENPEFKKEIFQHKLFKEILNGQLPESVISQLPVLWWHPEERFKASDPLPVFLSSRLIYRELIPYFPFLTKTRIDYGQINAIDWRSVNEAGAGPTSIVTRLHETGGIKKGYAGFELHYDPTLQNNQNAPLLWRLSKHPVFADLQPESPTEALVPIEFWYHMTYNYTSIHFGFHDGDWESFLFLFKVEKKDNELHFSPWMVSVSAHGHTTWRCFHNLTKHDNRPELFSALGTHATFIDEGIQPRLYPDRTARGENWKTWLNTRYLPKEPYYGFSGSWGRTSYVDFQNGPIPPGPDFKYLPRETEKAAAKKSFARVASGCSN